MFLLFSQRPSSPSSQNQDTAAWGTFYKYGLTGYMAFRGLCEFTGLAPSKGLCSCCSREGRSTGSPFPGFISLRWAPLNGPLCLRQRKSWTRQEPARWCDFTSSISLGQLRTFYLCHWKLDEEAWRTRPHRLPFASHGFLLSLTCQIPLRVQGSKTIHKPDTSCRPFCSSAPPI